MTGTDEEILALFDESLYIRLTLESDTEVTKSEEASLIELFKKQRLGEPPSIDREEPAQPAVLRPSATTSRAWALQAQLAPAHRRAARHPHITPRDIIELIKELISLLRELGIPESGMYEDEGEPIKDFAGRGDRHGAARSRTASTTSMSTSATDACARSAS